jgi:hypothetical protein
MKQYFTNEKYGIKEIEIRDYRRIGLVDLMDDAIMGFEDSRAIENVSQQHIQALLDDLVRMRNELATKAGINLKPVKPFKRKIL